VLNQEEPFTLSKLNRLDKKYSIIEGDMQMSYDDETYHSYVLKEQKRWQVYIDSGLARLIAYSSPRIYVRKRN
jgi:hypothetical protein